MAEPNPDPEEERRLQECESALGYQFRDRALLRRCLTHSSIATTRLDSNERLEFLGDAILGLVVCETLFEMFPNHPEGELTRLKSTLVSRMTCAKVARHFELETFLFLEKGLAQRTELPHSIIAAVFEALIAGVYLDGGLNAARQLIRRVLRDELEKAEEQRGRNYKSVLQQVAQKALGGTPVYQLLDEQGPDHSKCFNVVAVIGPRSFQPAWGASKKQAEQRAARNALKELAERNSLTDPTN